MDFRELFPQYTDEQLKEAEENLRRYFDVAYRVYERLRADPAAYAQFRALKKQRLELGFKRQSAASQANPPEPPLQSA